MKKTVRILSLVLALLLCVSLLPVSALAVDPGSQENITGFYATIVGDESGEKRTALSSSPNNGSPVELWFDNENGTTAVSFNDVTLPDGFVIHDYNSDEDVDMLIFVALGEGDMI